MSAEYSFSQIGYQQDQKPPDHLPHHNKSLTKETQQGFSIDRFHSVALLLADVRKMTEEGATQEGIERYIKRDAETFLMENAMKSPYHAVQYFQEGTEVFYPGNPRPVSERYRYAAEYESGLPYEKISQLALAEVQKLPRNVADAVAWDRELSSFFHGDYDYAFQISPPSIGQEGFGTDVYLNIFQKNKKIDGKIDINVRFLVLPGETINYDISRAIENNIKQFLPKQAQITDQNQESLVENAQRYLLQPILAKTVPGFELESFLETIGVDKDKIGKGMQYARKIENDDFIQLGIEQYTQNIISFLEAGNEFSEFDEGIIHDGLFTELYNRAVELKQAVDFKDYIGEIDEPRRTYFASDELKQAYYHSMAQQYNQEVRIAGGSCPVSVGKIVDSIMGEYGGVLNYGSNKVISQLFSDRSIKSVLEVKEKWVFNKEGNCKSCTKSHEKVGKLGPCMVCKNCQKDYDNGIKK